jgi:putative addiction module component (TIGR02574 family)
MANAVMVPPAGFDELPVDEQIDYVNFLWARILDNRQHVLVPAWHLQMLNERMADLEANPDGGQSWEDFEAEVRAERASRGR